MIYLNYNLIQTKLSKNPGKNIIPQIMHKAVCVYNCIHFKSKKTRKKTLKSARFSKKSGIGKSSGTLFHALDNYEKKYYRRRFSNYMDYLLNSRFFTKLCGF